ncbi:Cell growth regulatory protein CGR11 [Handroanthus impetiginosus]|uniref:Cell growth regulatory protein CGR11 n=1 Tax=Handroanthus impetiginosus TaxID=429701 RepID=A0A2G9GL78_9LAMI|nr:Cell growth regulatory protein CGR11 [Handroanthus impetiginosus]
MERSQVHQAQPANHSGPDAALTQQAQARPLFFKKPSGPGRRYHDIYHLELKQIPDVFPVLAAAHRTLIAKSRESLTTRSLHSELVYNYSGSKHISESLKRCGISDTTSYILVARFGATADEMTTLKALIKGVEIGLEELEARANQAQIQKHYKISAQEMGISSLSDAITCRIAARDAL